jgi:aspartate-semialdehyde dehydrogenase
MSERIPVAVLAATGSVGQRFIQLLDGHPWFEVVALTGSERSEGKTYAEACHWVLSEPMPAWARDLTVQPSTPEAVNAPIVFSALHTDVARTVEPGFAKAGAAIFSNASTYRQEPDVPILLPEVNPEQAGIIEYQRRARGWPGFIVTNANCTSTGMTIALKPVLDSFGIKRVFAVSLQAVSGAGYPGVPTLDILDNAIPYISGEEKKLEREPLKILGQFDNGSIIPAGFLISAHTNRVAVSDGHLVCLSVELEHPVGPEEAEEVLRNFRAPEISCDLPSAPHPVIQVHVEPDRPQPRLDRMTGKGMTTVVGRIRPDPIFHLKFVVLSHNTIRGAAGGSIYNAELLVKTGMIHK